jgi:hypoxanthine phosphoribosyltransferase
MTLELLISEQAIKQRLQEIGKELHEDYAGEEVTFVIVLKGALCVAVDLMRVVNFPVIVEAVTATSYGLKGTERGELVVNGVENVETEGRHVLIIDDVFDSGYTLSHIVSAFKEKRCKSVKSLVLLAKKKERSMDYVPDYSLFEIGPDFVVGYGMDFKELYRNLPGIFLLT